LCPRRDGERKPSFSEKRKLNIARAPRTDLITLMPQAKLFSAR
jgi:hypothetical protein